MSNILIGILHSLSGTMALSETPLVDATLMAIAEINQQGGVLGETIEPIVEDGASIPHEFQAKARKLITDDRVKTVFGCWTSLSRKAVLPVFENHNAILWYPVQYEGLEQSKHIFYTGSCLNQQIEPAVTWLLNQSHRRFFLVGSDYVFPRTANYAIQGQLKRQGGTVVGQANVPLGDRDLTAVIQQIQQCQPEVVFNTLNGDSNLAFYQQLREAGITAQELPVMAVSIAEAELQRMQDWAVDHYACWSYFQSLDTPKNHEFVENFQQRYGVDRVTSDPIEAAYTQVYLWKQAVEKAQSFDIDRVRAAAYGQEFDAPGGKVRIETNHHVWKECHVGKILADGQFEVVWSSDGLIKPLPWLGVEDTELETASIVIDLLSQVPQCVQYSWQLEQQSRQLETTMTQLQQEAEERQRSQEQLAQANREITLLNQRLKNENLHLATELEVNRKLQQMLLPKDDELSQIPDLDIAGFMLPAERVGGDYYDVLQKDDRLKIGIGDVTGHGLDSNVLMLMVQTAVRTLLESNETDPVRFLSILNETIYQNVNRINSEKNLSLALLDYHNGVLKLSGQHETMLVVRNGEIEEIDTIDLGFPIGLEKNITDFIAEIEIPLNVGDVVVLYTDGITEAENAEGGLYGIDRLCLVLKQNWRRSVHEIKQAILDDVRSHVQDQALLDDMTLLILKQK